MRRAKRAAEKLKKLNKSKSPSDKITAKKIAAAKKLSVRGAKKLNQLMAHSYNTRLSLRGANKKSELSIKWLLIIKWE